MELYTIYVLLNNDPRRLIPFPFFLINTSSNKKNFKVLLYKVFVYLILQKKIKKITNKIKGY